MKQVRIAISGYFLQNAWKKWPDIQDAHVPLPLAELLRFWLRFFNFPYFGGILTYRNVSNLPFPGVWWRTHDRKGALNLAVWYVSWPLSGLIWFWSKSLDFFFVILKCVKFCFSGYFLENTWEKWPEIWHVDVSWPHLEMISLWSWSVHFLSFIGSVSWLRVYLTNLLRFRSAQLKLQLHCRWQMDLLLIQILYVEWNYSVKHVDITRFPEYPRRQCWSKLGWPCKQWYVMFIRIGRSHPQHTFWKYFSLVHIHVWYG